MASLSFDLDTATEASMGKERATMTAMSGRSLEVTIPDASLARRFGRLSLLDRAYQQSTN